MDTALIELFESMTSVKAILVAVFGIVIAPGLQMMKPKSKLMKNPIGMFALLVIICGIIVTLTFWGFDGVLAYTQQHFIFTIGMALAAIANKARMKAAAKKKGA